MDMVQRHLDDLDKYLSEIGMHLLFFFFFFSFFFFCLFVCLFVFLLFCFFDEGVVSPRGFFLNSCLYFLCFINDFYSP